MKIKSCSLTIVCVIVFVVILFMIFSGSKNNMYGLIEGMETNDKSGNKLDDKSGDKPDDKSGNKPDDNSNQNPITAAISSSPFAAISPVKKSFFVGNKDTKEEDKKEENKKEEAFQVRKPVGYADIVESKGDSWNLSKWVKDAVRYSKGMGNENRLDSYKYHTGPKIPLPEGQLFFFTNTKFDSDCCPGTYSNSKGCACLSQAQYNHLMMRGGNNTPPKNTNTAYFNEF